jgi:hypothetical protein
MELRKIILSIAALFCTLALTSSCDMPNKSRFDEVAGVDVCALITSAEAEHILGPLQSTQPGTVTQSGSGIAGECTWTFKSLTGTGTGTLYAMMSTHASSPHAPDLDSYFDISQAEIEVSLGASPWKMDDLGDKAYLYQTRQPDHSEMWLLQSKTLFMLRMLGGSAAQLEEFARALSRELTPKE